MLRLDPRTLVLLVGASASGKSTWAARWFRPEQVVSSDALRAAVGESSHDQRASAAAFEVLERIVSHRLGRGLLAVVDSTGLDAPTRGRLLALARANDAPVVAVRFDVPLTELRARNRARPHPVPDRVVAAHARAARHVDEALADEGWPVHTPAQVRIVPTAFLDADRAAARQQEDPMPLEFGLSLPRFAWDGAPSSTRERLTTVARAAEEAGFGALYVMDHFVQIPSIGPVWEDMLESTTTLGFLAGVTERLRLGALVNGVTHRNLAVLGKAIATVDVLSGGRAICGLGAGWFAREHELIGEPFPPLRERFRLLEDALRFLPVYWGSGTPAFEGETFAVPEAICYPRPLQRPHPPLLVGGGGERRTLRLVASHADACNLVGGADLVRHKLDVLARHCADVGRDPDEIAVTQLAPALVGTDPADVAARVESVRRADQSRETAATALNAGTVDDHVGRFRELAEAGVTQAVVSLPPLADPEAIERFAPVIAAFR